MAGIVALTDVVANEKTDGAFYSDDADCGRNTRC
jgi:hypothetical protein